MRAARKDTHGNQQVFLLAVAINFLAIGIATIVRLITG